MENRVLQRKESNAKLVQEAIKATSSPSIKACVNQATGKSDKETQDSILYIVGEVSTGGKIELFELLTENQQRVGITNFDGNMLNTGFNAVVDAISIDVATSADGTDDPKELEYSEKADPAILNAHFKFEVEGKGIISLPVWEAHNPNTTRTNDEKYRGLGHLPIIEAQKVLRAELDFPIGITPDVTGGKKHYIRVSLKVLKTVSR